MRTQQIKAVLHHRQGDALPGGSLRRSDLSADVAQALEQIEVLLDGVPEHDSFAAQAALTDYGFGADADAPMDTPEWNIALIDEAGHERAFSIGRECGKSPVRQLTGFLESSLPSISPAERAALRAEIRSGKRA